MHQLSRNSRTFATLFVVALLAVVSAAQRRTFPEEDFYGDVKRTLSTHYIGKTVRAKLPIPANRRGLEMLDGVLQTRAEKNPATPLAQIGDELSIKRIRVGDSEIEVTLAPVGAPTPNPIVAWRQPRISMRFSRELNVQDLTIDKINRMLSNVVDVTALTPEIVVAAPEPPAAPTRMVQDPALVVRSTDRPVLSPTIGELTIESSLKDARIYIDGAFSGLTPRSIQLRAGVHTVLVMKEGFFTWEQKIFVPGAKAITVRAELPQ
jgi:hypothetical protein